MASRSRAAPLIVAGVLPAALLAVGVARFILNHFFLRAPYLLDSGWLSAVVYRAGLIPDNPAIACNWVDSYYGVHFSPILSVFSMLSYVAPLDRIEWYALFEALVYLPIGMAVHALSAHIDPEGGLRRLPLTFVAALAFSFQGLVIVFIGSPHYEAAIPGLICLLLAAVVTGHPRRAWIYLVLATSVREDAGFHAALALLPLLYLRWRGVNLPPRPRALARMIAVAVGASIAGILVQRFCFHAPSMLAHVYLGDPAYAHLDGGVLAGRARDFLETRQVIYYPVVATVVVAVLRRDPRYLLGWGAALPWFLLNFTAYEAQKSAFNAYAGFPFVVSVFWLYLYGARLAPEARRMRLGRAEAMFAIVCLSSTLGLYRASPGMLKSNLKEMAFHRTRHRAAVHGFVDAFGAHRGALGRLRVDPSVAGLAIEWVRLEDAWRPGVTPVDAIAFHRDTWLGDQLAPDLFANQLDLCAQIVGTRITVCSRERLSPAVFEGLATEVVPSVFAFSSRMGPGVRIEPRGVVLRDRAAVAASLGRLPRRTYRLTFVLDADASPDPDGDVPTRLEVMAGDAVRTSAAAPRGARELAVTFEVDGAEVIAFRLVSGVASALAVTNARLRPL
jgi:hypothetical protein